MNRKAKLLSVISVAWILIVVDQIPPHHDVVVPTVFDDNLIGLDNGQVLKASRCQKSEAIRSLPQAQYRTYHCSKPGWRSTHCGSHRR